MSFTTFRRATTISKSWNIAYNYSRRFYVPQPLGKVNGTEVLELINEMSSQSVEKIDPNKYFKLLNQLGKIIVTELKGSPGSLDGNFKNKVVTIEDMVLLYNQLIRDFAKDDYAIATVSKNALLRLPVGAGMKGRQPEVHALFELIKYNPGRVLSSWEMFVDEIDHKEENNSVLQAILNSINLQKQLVCIMVEKLLYGDECDKEDGFRSDIQSLIKIQNLIQLYGNDIMPELELPLSVQNTLLETLLDLNCPWLVNDFWIHPSILILKLEEGDNSFLEIAVLYMNLWKQDKENIPMITKMITLVARFSHDGVAMNDNEREGWEKFHSNFEKELDVKVSNSLESANYKENFQTMMDEMVSIIRDKKLDEDNSPEAELLRTILINAYGVQKDDLKQAKKLFDQYSSSSNSSTGIISAISMVYSYQSCVKKSTELLKESESLLLGTFKEVTNTPIKNLQATILANSYLGDMDHALEIFNKHIGSCSRDPDPKNGISDAVLITESLTLGYLCNFDREFAYLINDGAVENKILDNDIAMTRYKRLFKVYGAAFEVEDELRARLILQNYLINTLKSL